MLSGNRMKFPMINIALIAGVFAISTAATATSDSTPIMPSTLTEVHSCTHEIITIQNKNLTPLIDTLECIYTEYTELNLSGDKKAEKLFSLDSDIRTLVQSIHQLEPSDLELMIWEDKYSKLGLGIGDRFQYTGQLMLEADKLLPPYLPVKQRTKKYRTIPGEKFTTIKDSLERVYKEYNALHMKPNDAEKLYLLDQDIPKILTELIKYYPYQLSQVFWEEKYLKIGLGIGHYSDQLEYSGKLIIDAHKVNPNSLYREETLFAAIFGSASDGNLDNGHPNIKLFYAYLREFPNSTHALNIYSNLADFYHGLYKYLRYRPKTDQAPYTYLDKDECYKPYISKLPIKTQLADAKEKGISFYNKLISQTSQEKIREDYMKDLAALENGVDEERDAWCDVMD
jgi:hypothetical protein